MIFTLSVVAIISTSWVLHLAESEHQKMSLDEHESHLYALSRSIALQLAPVLAQNTIERDAIDVVFSQLKFFRHVVNVSIYDNQHRLIDSYNAGGKLVPSTSLITKRPDLTTPGISVLTHTLLSTERIGAHNYPVGYLQIVYDLHNSPAFKANSLAYNVVPWFVLVLIATILLAIVVLRRAFYPLETLTRFTQMVTDTKDYSARHNVKGTDEIKHLGQQINRLMAIIEDEMSTNHRNTQRLVEQQATMQKLANVDNLTGLPNRQFVMDTLKLELRKLQRNGEDLMLMYFDLDGFKSINDSLGHETGDLVLIEVAKRVKAVLRDGDIVARLGGDEFIVISERAATSTNIEIISKRILTAFIQPFDLKGLSLKVGISIGIACAKDAGYDVNQWISNADLAMYRSKANGRGSYTVFDPALYAGHKRKITIAESIERAIGDGQFSLYYQHKVNKQGEVDSLEALLRWRHPELGDISPGEFIPIAEHAGKISQVTRWVLSQAASEVGSLLNVYGKKLRVAMNLSAHDLRQKAIFDWIYEALTQHKTNPANIEFEVTESAYLDNFTTTEGLFKRLHNLGCTIALDDFGTGYSSLSYLTQITIDTLKIDRQFVSQLDCSAKSQLVTMSIIDLAKRLGMKVCAEGVETRAQWDYLCEQGCDTTQGYLISRPMPLAAILANPLAYQTALVDTSSS